MTREELLDLVVDYGECMQLLGFNEGAITGDRHEAAINADIAFGKFLVALDMLHWSDQTPSHVGLPLIPM